VKIVKESIEFERGIEPAKAMGIGINIKWLLEFEDKYFRLSGPDDGGERLDAKNKFFQVLDSYQLEEVIPRNEYNDFFQGVREKEMKSFKLDDDIIFSTDGWNGVVKVFYNDRWKTVALNSRTSVGKKIVNHLIKKVEQGDFIERKKRSYRTEELVPMKEELIGRANDREVYKNPPSISNFSNWTRAISTKSGDLYVAEKYDLIHTIFIKYLKSKGILKSNEGWQQQIHNDGTYTHEYVNLIAWQRYKNTKSFYLSESYQFIEEHMKNMEKMAQNVRKKNPQYKFHLKGIPDNAYF